MASLACGSSVGGVFVGNVCCQGLSQQLRVTRNVWTKRSNKSCLPLWRPRPVQGSSGSTIISCSAAGAAGQPSSSDENPYQVLGVSPLEKFDVVKTSYNRKVKEAERRGDDAAMARFERAYDKIMMAQLANRKQGRTYGDFEIPKEIKYADKRVLIPWGPKVAFSSKNDCLINFAVSNFIAIWIFVSHSADWKPLQFVIFVYAWRIFNKLKDFEPPTSSFLSEDEDQKRREKNGKRLVRTLCLVFGCVAIASLAFTGVLNGFELLGQYIPRSFLNSQELFVTILSSVLLFITGSYLR